MQRMKGGDNITKSVRRISFVIVLLVLVAIWQFSAQTATESSGLSGSLARFLATLLNGASSVDMAWLDHVLRKMAHFSVYCVLGCGLAGIVVDWKARSVFMLMLPIGFLLAAVDEFHQSFVPGRGPKFSDVLLDTLGILVGITFVLLLRRLYRRRKKALQK